MDKNEIKLLNNQELVPEDNFRFNDFLACYWQKKGWQDEKTGKINYKSIKKLIEDIVINEMDEELSLIRILVKQILGNVIGYCQDESVKGSTHGQTIAKVQNCIIKTLNQLQEEIQEIEP